MSEILVVDDEEAIAEAIALRLEGEGHRARWAASLAEARAALRDDRFDLAIVDRVLPDGDGFDLVEEARRTAGRDFPVLVLTGLRTRPDEVEGGFVGGANAYLTKPFEAAQLVAAVERLLAERRDGAGPAGAAEARTIRAGGPVLGREGAERLAREIGWLIEGGAARIEIDLGGVERLVSEALGVLVPAVRRARGVGAAVSLENLRPTVREALEVLGAHRVLGGEDGGGEDGGGATDEKGDGR